MRGFIDGRLEGARDHGPPPLETMLESIDEDEFTAYFAPIDVYAGLLVLPQERRILIESFA